MHQEIFLLNSTGQRSMTLGKSLVPSLRWAGISLYKYVCYLSYLTADKLIFNKSSILGMEPVTTSTRTSLVFFVTHIVMVAWYATNLRVELLKKKSKAKVLYAYTCGKCLAFDTFFSRVNPSGYQEVQRRSNSTFVFPTANGEIAERYV